MSYKLCVQKGGRRGMGRRGLWSLYAVSADSVEKIMHHFPTSGNALFMSYKPTLNRVENNHIFRSDCCPYPCHCAVPLPPPPPPQLLLLLHHTSWLLMLHRTSWLLMLLLHCMVGCGRGRSLVVVIVIVVIGRCRSLSMVVVVVVGGRCQWSLLSLPLSLPLSLLLSLLSRLVVGRSWSVVMVGHGHDCNHHATCRGHCTLLQPHVSCESSILLKKCKSAYLLRRRCRGVVLGG